MISFRQYLLETGIKDNDVYLSNMQKSFQDKAWFVRHMSPAVGKIVDFGGGNGDFCAFLEGRVGKGVRFAVIDNNPVFLATARTRGFDAYESVSEFAEADPEGAQDALLNMSSVIHEIYSYADADAVWKEVRACGFRQIAIRDMNVSESDYRDVPKDAVVWAYENVFTNPVFEIKGVPLAGLMREFEDRWGAVCEPETGRVDVKNLIHFLVKYRYVENWERELDENYFPISQARLERTLNGIGYALTHKESSRLPFYAKQWAKDFKLNRPDGRGMAQKLRTWLGGLNTHIKWMAERVG